ncbi:MAG TPA: hypothetical protein VMV17_05410 [Streptosporangiaceae bacterium]|nr:hypothetical protein [Streptosporangiaceae bacterium]
MAAGAFALPRPDRLAALLASLPGQPRRAVQVAEGWIRALANVGVVSLLPHPVTHPAMAERLQLLHSAAPPTGAGHPERPALPRKRTMTQAPPVGPLGPDVAVTHILVVTDPARARDFWVDVLGAERDGHLVEISQVHQSGQ